MSEFRCPVCQCPHDTLERFLTCCPRELRALANALEANTSLGSLKALSGGLAGATLRKHAAGLLGDKASAAPVVRFPDVRVRLSGEDEGGFAIIARTRRALERAGHREAARAFFEEAMTEDYPGLLRLVRRTVLAS